MPAVPLMPAGKRESVRLPLFLCGTAAAYAVAGNVPVAGYAVMLILIAGLIFYTATRGPLHGSILAAAVTAITAAGRYRLPGDAGNAAVLVFAFEAGGAALVTGWALHSRAGALRALWTGAAAPFVLFLLLMTDTAGLRGIYDGAVEEARNLYTERAAAAGIEAGAGQTEALDRTLNAIRHIYPGAVFVSALATLCLAYLLLQVFTRRRGITVLPLLPPLAFWRLPFWPVWVLAGSIAGSLWGNGVLREAAFNGLFIGGCLYLAEGVAVLKYAAAVRRISPFMEYASYLLLVTAMPFSGVALALLGLFDIWFDFRKINVTA